jgi:hypothetical protein
MCLGFRSNTWRRSCQRCCRRSGLQLGGKVWWAKGKNCWDDRWLVGGNHLKGSPRTCSITWTCSQAQNHLLLIDYFPCNWFNICYIWSILHLKFTVQHSAGCNRTQQTLDRTFRRLSDDVHFNPIQLTVQPSKINFDLWRFKSRPATGETNSVGQSSGFYCNVWENCWLRVRIMDMGGFTFNRIAVPPIAGEKLPPRLDRFTWPARRQLVSFLTHANPLLWKIF